jgi:rhomboid family GlyGly-CTERM serine protease
MKKTLQSTRSFGADSAMQSVWPELWAFGLVVVVLGLYAVVTGSPGSLVFLPERVAAGEWWRVVTHPFVHVSWYHLLLDGAAFFLLYAGLAQPRRWVRLAGVAGAAAGAVWLPMLLTNAVSERGLCGLSGVAHGLMAVAGLEMIRSGERAAKRWGWCAMALVLGKSIWEAATGRVVMGFLHFGLVGDPVAMCHLGGVLGGLAAYVAASHLCTDRAAVSGGAGSPGALTERGPRSGGAGCTCPAFSEAGSWRGERCA